MRRLLLLALLGASVLGASGCGGDDEANEPEAVALEVAAFEAIPERREVRLRLDARSARAGIVRELATLLRDFPGDSPVYVAMQMTAGSRLLEFGPGYRVAPNPDFYAEVKALLGEAAVL